MYYVDTAVEDSKLYCYNTEGGRNSVVSQAFCHCATEAENLLGVFYLCILCLLGMWAVARPRSTSPEDTVYIDAGRESLNQ